MSRATPRTASAARRLRTTARQLLPTAHTASRPAGEGVTQQAQAQAPALGRAPQSAAGCSSEAGEGDADRGSCLYFAYGSNMTTAHTVTHLPSAVALGTASLPNYSIGFRRLSPGPQFVGGISTAEPAAGQTVEGVLFRVAVAELESWDADYAEDRYYRSPVLVSPRSAAAPSSGAAAPGLVMAEVVHKHPPFSHHYYWGGIRLTDCAVITGLPAGSSRGAVR